MSTLRQQLQYSTSYTLAKETVKYMDNYHLDPLIGFVLPMGIGDILTQTLALPFLYISAVKIGSWKLTLAVIFNMLVDILLGAIPFFIGDVIDVFNKSYKRNMALIDGYVVGDPAVKETVEKNAVTMAILIVIMILLIYALWSIAGCLLSGIFFFLG